MAPRFLLNTNICIYIQRQKPENEKEFLRIPGLKVQNWVG